MSTPILATKLYIPPLRSKVVLRPRLVERLNKGLHGKLTLISAPAGFGKTTVVSEWIAHRDLSTAWLSLDVEDNDPIRFLTYLTGALQTIEANIGHTVVRLLQAPQPPPIETILTALVNAMNAIPGNFILILDDYHVIDSKVIDNTLAFLIEHLPPQMHLVIATREDPQLPLPRLRARNQLTELRAADLRFTYPETAGFLNQMMELKLSKDDIAALETRTEGWIVGLQLAAISMQGHRDATDFIKSFTGSHRFVLDYLAEEVLHQQPESVQNFLLSTSILNRLCGPLCDAVLLTTTASGQETLEYLERVNLFTFSLDNERRWYRYHHLFADLLSQRLRQSIASSPADAESRVNELHIRASQWYEDNNLDIEAFHHAALGHDIDRAERLIEGKGIPLHLRGAVIAILNWLESLPTAVLNARPSLWWRHASLLLVNGQTTGVEEKLNAAEAALQGREEDENIRNLIGRIATARATLALTRYQTETMITQSRRALEYLPPSNLFHRATANWSLGYAYLFQGNSAAARVALNEALSLSQRSGYVFITILAMISLGNLEETENHLVTAAETYQSVLRLSGDQPLQIIYEAHLGLARVLYEWNDLDAAEQHGQQSLLLAKQYDRVIDRFIVCEVFLARLKLAQGDINAASAMLAQALQSARQQNFVLRIPEVAALQVVTLIRQGDLIAAAQLAQAHQLPLSQARVHLAQGDTTTALEVLASLRQQAEEKGQEDERLRVLILQAVTLYIQGEEDSALQILSEALVVAEPQRFIRSFVDEGTPMAHLLRIVAGRGGVTDYTNTLLAVFEAETQKNNKSLQSLLEPLTQREVQVLRLIAQGLSNQEISEQLFLALDTVKGHNRRIYDKLGVQRRTEAVARARELGLV